ncbi:DNA replication protein psf2 [Malassezia arunalokei]|uniref:DNA replication complex GINS protein PSF2 n=1 Tax=Malassezia arunalokei TaxID=1514897 RepID=A0AAJ6CK15_9BASI|nr:DNA replication protein psf2 [Malassezia arunalokei]
MEYVASSETIVDILPLISLDRVRLLSGTYGPFQPPTRAQVPLWLAILLRKKRKCVIVPPEWLSIAHLLLEHAAEEIPDASRVRALLKDLREARQSKILAGLGMINPAHLEMSNISSMEICELRPLFVTALSQLHALHGSSNDANTENMPSQTSESVAPNLDDDDENISVRRV